jgi:hypothetical protein
VTLRVRDLDDGGALLWVAADGGKTEAATRRVEVDEELQPYLLALAQGKDPNAFLFAFESQRHRRTLSSYNSRRDALLRRVNVPGSEGTDRRGAFDAGPARDPG